MNAIDVVGVFLLYLCHTCWMVHLIDNSRITKKKIGLIYAAALLISIVTCFVMISVIDVYQVAAAAAFILTCLLYLVLFLYLSRDPVSKKLFLFLSYSSLYCVVQNLSYLIAAAFFEEDTLAYRFVGIAARTVLELSSLLIYLRWGRPRLRNVRLNDNKQWLPLCVVAALFFCLLSVWTAVGKNIWYYEPVDYLIFALLTVCASGVYVVIFHTIRYMDLAATAGLVRQQSKYLSEQVELFASVEADSRKLIHDVRHHLMNLASYARAGDTGAILNYIQEYDDAILALSPQRYALHPAVNNLLCVYAERCRKEGIGFSVQCRLPENLPAKDVDLIALLGNLLENALHGCLESESTQKNMEVALRTDGEKLVVVVKNTCSATLKVSDGLPHHRGVGIASMLSVCDHYGGTLNYFADQGVCSVCAVLRLTV